MAFRSPAVKEFLAVFHHFWRHQPILPPARELYLLVVVVLCEFGIVCCKSLRNNNCGTIDIKQAVVIQAVAIFAHGIAIVGIHVGQELELVEFFANWNVMCSF